MNRHPRSTSFRRSFVTLLTLTALFYAAHGVANVPREARGGQRCGVFAGLGGGLFHARCARRRQPCRGYDVCDAGGAVASVPKWRPLLDGKTLTNWKVSDFAGHGEVEVKDGVLLLGSGESLTGVTWTGDTLPKTNYEIEVEARRLDGVDFFCGITFPVGDSHCSFIPGGWGGGVVGLSSIDDFDASENETTRFVAFKDKQWYRLRVRVTKEKIQCWIDDKQVVDQSIKGRKISVRFGIEEATPLGLTNWQSTGAVRNLRLRRVDGPAPDTRSNEFK